MYLKKRRSNFERESTHATNEEKEEHKKACEESEFRINILEKRIKYHEKQALQKYTDMEKRLRNDPRLKLLN